MFVLLHYKGEPQLINMDKVIRVYPNLTTGSGSRLIAEEDRNGSGYYVDETVAEVQKAIYKEL